MSADNVKERLDRIVASFDAQIDLVERDGAEGYYGDLFDAVPASDYWVYTGLGRSRHIADKVSASLASTGTPSYFVDTRDDSTHGTLLTNRDRLMLVHRRGADAHGVAKLCASIPENVSVDVITDAPADVPSRPGQVLPVVGGESPPASVEADLLSLAVGDSLVAGLESARGFTEVDFLRDHPKGSLGKNISAAQTSGAEAAVDYLPPAEQAIAALRMERDGVAALWPVLDKGALSEWLGLLDRPWRRIVTTGMGKPGYCMRYLTVLLNELGRPAFYLHPAESVHGDLGRIGPDSLVLAYSHSGETDEMLNILPRTKERGATLVSLTNNPESTLGKESHVTLKAGAPEVDPIGKAPTGSTTAALSLATALVRSALDA